MTRKNLAASVRARLANCAQETGRPFQEVLQYYAMERFLYRFSLSRHHDRFILKGALMLRVWKAPMARPTRDIDLLGHFDNSVEGLVAAVREFCALDVEPDGMLFDANKVTGERIKEDADYEGVRIRFDGRLENARVRMQLDIAFGDVVTPEPGEIEYPALLDLPPPELCGYPRETVVAEKLQAMVYLGRLNSRMKDFYDLWLLARQFEFSGSTLAQAIKATFSHRRTEIDSDPVALTPEFTRNDPAATQWRAFIRKGRLEKVPQELHEVADFVRTFLSPVAKACTVDASFDKRWPPPGPWRL